MKIAIGVVAVAVAGVLLVRFVAERRWESSAARLEARLTNEALAAQVAEPRVFHHQELDGLPPPVIRYLSTVIPDGHPLIRIAHLTSRGEFLVRPGPKGWRPFRAEQTFTTEPAGFVWDAKIRMAPGLDVLVRDAFVGGVGSMRAAVSGLVSLANARGTPELASGALHRFLGEALWLPTALLPSQGAVWTAIDDSTARVTRTVRTTTVSLDVHFDRDGMVAALDTPARYRDVRGRGVLTPWRVRLHRFESRDGMLIPVAAEVEWMLPEGPLHYWRGEILEARYEYDRP